jgi:hypothetical protein
MTQAVPNAKYRIEAALDLLDRQMKDRHGAQAGKVDDLELSFEDDVGAPYVSAILAGPGILAPRLAPRLGGWVASFRRRLAPGARPSRVDFSFVSSMNSHVQLIITCQEMEVVRSERWAQERFIRHIPGSA